MRGRPTMLDEATIEVLVQQVRAGARDETAAAAAGVSTRTFERWMERGEQGEEPYATMERAVRQARAQARVEAEKWVWEHQPLLWLLCGPGRERPGAPGWSAAEAPMVGAELGRWIGEQEGPELRAELAALWEQEQEGSLGRLDAGEVEPPTLGNGTGV